MGHRAVGRKHGDRQELVVSIRTHGILCVRKGQGINNLGGGAVDGIELHVPGRWSTRMIAFAVEPLSVAWDNIARLADECWNEIEADKHVEPHDMRRERYQEYEDAGMLYCAIARDRGEAIGFGIGIVYDSLHTQVRICVDDGIYLKPARSEERRGGKECRSRWSPD